MPVATPEQYAQMLDAAQKGGYAYPAINITSLTTANGALKAFAETENRLPVQGTIPDMIAMPDFYLTL